ncbi:hypothetical protein [Roseateles albus]|uniref:hypothetical protein n=1 Tax=Roseateles albus TaxID=2987525 RepID=UPI0023583E91|nr:hypothetical protein [Roseateles albus]
MIRSLLLFAGLAVSGATYAVDSCAVQAIRLMSQGRLSELSAMFTAPGEDVARGLAQLASFVGPIEAVLPLSRQTDGVYIRKSVAVDSLPSSYKFDGSWAVATSGSGGRFEFQASSEPGSSCKLFALHVDKLSK